MRKLMAMTLMMLVCASAFSKKKQKADLFPDGTPIPEWFRQVDEVDVSKLGKQYKITEKQRRLEREVRYWRTEAITYKGTNEKYYKYARKKAIEYNKKYIAFSKANERAYYPSRTKLI